MGWFFPVFLSPSFKFLMILQQRRFIFPKILCLFHLEIVLTSSFIALSSVLFTGKISSVINHWTTESMLDSLSDQCGLLPRIQLVPASWQENYNSIRECLLLFSCKSLKLTFPCRSALLSCKPCFSVIENCPSICVYPLANKLVSVAALWLQPTETISVQ